MTCPHDRRPFQYPRCTARRRYLSLAALAWLTTLAPAALAQTPPAGQSDYEKDSSGAAPYMSNPYYAGPPPDSSGQTAPDSSGTNDPDTSSDRSMRFDAPDRPDTSSVHDDDDK